MDKKGLFALFQQYAAADNVVGVGMGHKWQRGEDTGKKAVVILVRKKLAKDDLKRTSIIPKRINNIATDVVEAGDIRLLSVPRTELCRPALPGSSIGHYKVSAGTFGAIVFDKASGEAFILSNNHVLANLSDGSDDRANIGDEIIQPGAYDGGDVQNAVIGHLARFIPIRSKVCEPSCKIAKIFEDLLNKFIHTVRPQYRIRVLRESPEPNYVDCAVARPVSRDLIKPEIIEIGEVNGTVEAMPGKNVKKSGRSSGLTTSMILATDVTVKVVLDSSCYGVFSDQILAGPMSMPGDSGSLVVSEDNKAVGLLFAGSEQVTMINRIERVLDALNIRI